MLSAPFPHRLSLFGQSAAARPDRSIAVAGSLQASAPYPGMEPTAAFAVGSFLAHGPADAAFGEGGAVHQPTPGYAAVDAVAAGPDGALLVGGWDGSVPFVARFTARGELDRTFGADGFVRSERPEDTLGAATLALRALADGTIAVVQAVRQPVDTGRSAPGGLVFLRLRSDGSVISKAVHSAAETRQGNRYQYASWPARQLVPTDRPSSLEALRSNSQAALSGGARAPVARQCAPPSGGRERPRAKDRRRRI